MPAFHRKCPGLAPHNRNAFAFRCRLLTGQGGDFMAWYLLFADAGASPAEVAGTLVLLANVGEMGAFASEDDLDAYICGDLSGVDAYVLLQVGNDKRPLPTWAAEVWDAFKADPRFIDRLSMAELAGA